MTIYFKMIAKTLINETLYGFGVKLKPPDMGVERATKEAQTGLVFDNSDRFRFGAFPIPEEVPLQSRLV